MTVKNQPTSFDDGIRNNTSKDEINFYELLYVLYSEKIVILLITFIFVLLAVVYSLLATPIYSTKIAFAKPSGIIAPEWIQTKLALAATNQSLYEQFIDRMSSYRDQRSVFDKEDFFKRFVGDSTHPPSPEKLLWEINTSISVIKGPKGTGTYVQMEGSKPEIMADFLHRLSEATIHNIQTETLILLQAKINNRVKFISNEIETIKTINKLERKNRENEFENKIKTIKIIIKEEHKELEEERKKITNEIKIERQYQLHNQLHKREDRLGILSEQLALAQKLGIKKNNFDNLKVPAPKWYSHGESAIRAEINALKSKTKINTLRANSTKTGNLLTKLAAIKSKLDQPSVSAESSTNIALAKLEKSSTNIALAKLELEAKQLKSINASQAKPEVALIDLPNTALHTQIRPDQEKMILLGILLGLGTGVIFVILRNGIANLKKQKVSLAAP